VYHRGVQDYESLEGADSVGFRLHIFELFRQYQEIYYLRSEGGLGPRLWREFEAGMRDVNEWPGVQAWWRSRSHWFTEEFAKHVDQLQQRGTRPSLYREPEAHQ
jgi:hypothetical protein